jgi:hypothetical protein
MRSEKSLKTIFPVGDDSVKGMAANITEKLRGGE